MTTESAARGASLTDVAPARLRRCSTHVLALAAASVLLACAGTAGFEAAPDTYTTQSVQIEGETAPRVVALVDSTFFGGTQPLLGRSFAREEYAQPAPSVAVLSHAFWTERFGARPTIIGSPLQIDGVMRTVVGVMPAYVDVPENVVLWLPRR